MIGSLAEFIEVDQNHLFIDQDDHKKEQQQILPIKNRKYRGKSHLQTYVAQDKTDLLMKYEKNNIYHINRKKFNSLAKQIKTKQKFRKPLYQHRSFFSKPDFNQDYIAKEELKRKHNLLRAILRMKQTEEQPKGQSDYEQSFQRLYQGFKNIHPEPILNRIQRNIEQTSLPVQRIVPSSIPTKNNSLSGSKRIQYENCLRWARKHNKNGDFFAVQLGKFDKKKQDDNQIMNRSLISQISRKVQYNILQHLQHIQPN